MKVRDIPIDQIFVTKNVRHEDGDLGEMMRSLRRRQLQPAGVIPRPGDPRGEYELIWGHRRLKSKRLDNEQSLSCSILEGVTDAEIAEIKLEENIQRRDLSPEEIVDAADEMKRTHPGMLDTEIDRRLHKQPGYLSNMRSTVRAAQYLLKAGLSKKAVDSMSGDEMRSMRAEFENKGKRKSRRSTFHRGPETPAKGFRLVNTPGPNVIVVCAGRDEKLHVLRTLRALARKEYA